MVDDLIYETKELDINETHELFRWNAFPEDKPIDDFFKLIDGVISYVRAFHWL
jgi:hypothetical protein